VNEDKIIIVKIVASKYLKLTFIKLQIILFHFDVQKWLINFDPLVNLQFDPIATLAVSDPFDADFMITCTKAILQWKKFFRKTCSLCHGSKRILSFDGRG